MRRAYSLFLLLALGLGHALLARGQEDESPSLGDVARQARLKKQAGNVAAEQTTNRENSAVASTEASSQSAAARTSKSSSTTAQNQAGTLPINPAKNAQAGKTAKKVLTNEDMGSSLITADSALASNPESGEHATSERGEEKNPPDYWTSKILAQKNSIASLKGDIDQLSASIQYAPGNCVEGCVQWNEQQQQKQQQVDTMKAQLEEQQKQLEEMQETARKQGYGNSVYDP